MDTRLVLDIDDDLRSRLEARARTNHRSLEDEAKAILQADVELLDDDPSLPAGTRIARLFSGSGIGFRDGEIEEFRFEPVRGVEFDR